MILIYILSLLAIILLSFKYSKGDYFNLTFILLAGYLASAICCLYNVALWGVDVQFKTIAILFSGMVAFALGSYFGKILARYSKNNTNMVSIYQVLEKGDSYSKLLIVTIMDIVIIMFLYDDIQRIANLNFVSWGNSFYNFRSNLGNSEIGANYSLFVNLGLRLTKPLAYIYMTIFCSSILNDNPPKIKLKKIIYLLPVIIYGIQVILQGFRVQLIALIVASFFCYFFLSQIKYNWKSRIDFSYICKISIVVAFICVAFYYVKFFIGKLQDSNGVIAYVTNYLGGSLQLFDMYLLDPVNDGHETFAAMVDSLKRFGFFKEVSTVVQHEYRSASTGVYIGNVYTGFRNYYNDFGFFGMLFFSTFLGVIFSYWYSILKKIKHWNVNRLFGFIVYSSFIYMIVFHFFADYFFSLIGVGWFINMGIFYLLVVWIFKIKFKF